MSQNIFKDLDSSSYVLILAILLCATVFQWMANDWFDAMRYQREGLLQWQLWRLFSGHLIHLSWTHLVMNGLGLLLMVLLFSHVVSGRRWWFCIGVSALVVSLGLLWLSPEVLWYVGFSGVLHGMLMFGALSLLPIAPKMAWTLVLISVVKLLAEQLRGPVGIDPQWIGGNVIVDAHLYGALGGVMGFVLIRALAGRRLPWLRKLK